MDFEDLYEEELREFLRYNGYPDVPFEHLGSYAKQLFAQGTALEITVPILALHRATQYMKNSPIQNDITKTKLNKMSPDELIQLGRALSLDTTVPYLKQLIWRIAELQDRSTDYRYDLISSHEMISMNKMRVKVVPIMIINDVVSIGNNVIECYLMFKAVNTGQLKKVPLEDPEKYIQGNYPKNYKLDPSKDVLLTDDNQIIYDPTKWINEIYRHTIPRPRIYVYGRHSFRFILVSLDDPRLLDDIPNRIYDSPGYMWYTRLEDLEISENQYTGSGMNSDSVVYKSSTEGDNTGFIIVDADPNTF